MEFEVAKFEETFVRAKLMAYVTKSTKQEKEKLLEELRAKMEEAMELVEKIVEGEV